MNSIVPRRLSLPAALALALLLACGGQDRATAQDGDRKPTRFEITGGVFEPVGIAVPPLVSRSEEARQHGQDVAQVVLADLEGTGLFRGLNPAAFIESIADFSIRPRFENWRILNAQWLMTGESLISEDGRLTVRFRLWDVFEGRLATGLQLAGASSAWRRIAHRIADAIYAEVTGEGPYFDTRIAFVDETGPKNAREKRLALMDQDGANLRYLTGTGQLSMTPRFSPSRQEIAYISYAADGAQVYLYEIDTGTTRFLGDFPGMSFAPRFSPAGDRVVMSIAENGNTDIYVMDLSTRETRRLTSNPAIDTSPSFSPDGRQIVFESDRGSGQQLYVMEADGAGDQFRISFGDGNYATPVWSPRGDLIAFTKREGGEFNIGVMTPDGRRERLLTSSFHNEGPTWAPNGRVLMFFREFPGAHRPPKLYSVDISGRSLRQVDTPRGASDPAWSSLLE